MDYPIVIVGAGISGLTAALHLEEYGHSPIIIESSDSIGGRIKTDEINGFLLDHGFQVLLTHYPEVNRYFNLTELQLLNFDPGAVIYHNDTQLSISDPMRDFSSLLPMLFSKVGTIKDKILMLKLNNELKNQPIENLFQPNDHSTLEYLNNFGFSRQIIERFFKPFFTGIFLEKNLQTPASMFRFVFRMFSEGHAAIPAQGMKELPIQLFKKLKRTQIRFNTTFKSYDSRQVFINDEASLPFSRLIIPSQLESAVAFNPTLNCYFSSDTSLIEGKKIALVTDDSNPLNNFCQISNIVPTYAPPGKHLISVSLKPGTYPHFPEITVKKALSNLLGKDTTHLKLLKSFYINEALPIVENLKYDIEPSQTAVFGHDTFLTGDSLLYPSLDAALKSGRRAAQGVLESL
jgi:hypothetical protein